MTKKHNEHAAIQDIALADSDGVVAPATALAAPAPGALAPSRDLRGKADLGSAEDVLFPRLSLAQKTSPQLDPSKSEYIPDLRLFQIFNSLTGENYGNGPLDVIIIRGSKRAMEFDAQMHVVDFDVPLDDPRLQFTEGLDGMRVKPKATLFYDYLVLLPDGSLAVLSLKTTQIKTAKQINSLMMLTPGPAWARKYTLASTSKQHGQYTAAAWTVKMGAATTPEEREAAETWFDTTANFAEKVDRREAQEKGDDDIPF
jgi:hypothetical protein